MYYYGITTNLCSPTSWQMLGGLSWNFVRAGRNLQYTYAHMSVSLLWMNYTNTSLATGILILCYKHVISTEQADVGSLVILDQFFCWSRFITWIGLTDLLCDGILLSFDTVLLPCTIQVYATCCIWRCISYWICYFKVLKLIFTPAAMDPKHGGRWSVSS